MKCVGGDILYRELIFEYWSMREIIIAYLYY